MIIGICGFGYSGSGALIDYLKEIDGVTVLDSIEMNLLYIPDGVKDLEYHLCENHYRFMSSDVAIFRFLNRMETIAERIERGKAKQLMQLAYRFVDSLTLVTWKGYSFSHRGEYSRRERYWKFKFPAQLRFYLKKLHVKLPPAKNPTREMRLSVSPENFEEEAQRFVRDVIALFLKEPESSGQMIVIDQLFAADNTDTCVKYVPNCKVITVVRDPRDIYLLIKKGLNRQVSFIPTDDVQSFVKYFLALTVPRNQKSNSGIVVRYEDLIYDYERTTQEVCAYLDIPWSSTRQYFDPEVSIRNTQLFKRFPDYVEDIRYIEVNCREYLYDFKDEIEVDTNKELF